ncbi:MAG: hypothetical protein HOP29_01900 [Phycisphaerales bacterium]|nr:hypothetical protein [Phycisphaerales bacterium]
MIQRGIVSGGCGRWIAMVLAVGVFPALHGCPAASPGAGADDGAGQPVPGDGDSSNGIDVGEPDPNGDGNDDSTVDGAIADGTYGGMAKRTVTLMTPENTIEAAEATDIRVIVEVTEGRLATVRFGSGTLGVFDKWTLEAGESVAVIQAVGRFSVDVNRILVVAGERSVAFTSLGSLAEEADQPASIANGNGMITIAGVDGGVSFMLQDELSYMSGPLSGRRQIESIEGTLEEMEPIAVAEDDATDESTGDDVDEDPNGEGDVLPIVAQAADVAVDGTQTLPGGVVVPFVGMRTTEELTETITNPEGEPLNIVEEQFVREIELADGTVVTETSVERTYLSYDENGGGVVRGYQEDGVDRFIVSPAEGVPGTIDSRIGATRSYTATYNDGTVETLDQTVTGTAELVMSDGVVTAFVSTVHVERNHPNGRRQIVDMTVWFRRVLGVVQRHVNGSVFEPDGSVRTLVFDEVLAP